MEGINMKKTYKIVSLLLAVVMLVSLFAGCGTNTDNETPTTTTDTESSDSSSDTTVANGGVKLNLVISEELSTVDPALNYSMGAMQMITLTNQGLMTFDENGQVTCGLAESYDVSEDGTTYTFHIRDAYWSNGTKVTSNDFLFSWSRLTDPATGSAYSYMLYTLGVVNALDVALGNKPVSELGISAPDENTFVVNIDGPRPYFLYLIAMASYFMAVNEEYYNSDPDNFGVDIDHYISCGPYIFSDWQVGGTSVTLVKNPNYYDVDKVTCDELTFNIMTDSAQMMMGWDNGTIDYVGLSGDYLDMYRDDAGLDISDMAAMYFLSMNMEDPQISNDNLRMALNLAIDKTVIVDNILNNGSLVADYIIPDTFAVDENGVDYRDRIGNPTYNTCDKAKAAELFEAAKAELGTDTITIDFLYSDDISADICVFIKSEWENALPGLTVNLEQTTYNNRLERMSQHDYQVGFTRWYADYQDPLTYLDMWISTSQMNYGQYNNPEYDALYYEVTGELAMDTEGREAAMKEMEAMILGDGAICPLYQLASCSLANPNYNWVKNVAGVVQYQFVSYK
jgi:oligopeptide transport system substrate-binding protein